MDSIKRQARVAGFLYFLVLLVAPFGELYVPGRLIVRGDATETASRILASESLFRFGLASEILGSVLFLLVVLALYRLLGRVDANLAGVMLALVVVAIPIALLGAAFELAALTFFKGADFLAALDKPQRDALGYAFLRLSGQSGSVASLFWGLWLFPFGVLVVRSGFIPRAFGYLVMVAGAAYVVGMFAALLAPGYSGRLSTWLMPLMFFEVPVIFWLLIWGAKTPPAAGASAAPAS